MGNSNSIIRPWCRGRDSDGQPCWNMYFLDEEGYCITCRGQSPGSPQCTALLSRNNERCKVRVGVNSAGYCYSHSGRRPTANRKIVPTSARNDDNPANEAAASSDPKVLDVVTKMIREGNLRSKMKSRVLERFSSKDIYDLSEVDKTAHLDHIVELQIFVYVLRRLQDDEDWEMARQLCYIVANNIANLGLTSANINRIKGQAVRRFLTDLKGNRAGKPLLFTSYLQEANGSGKKLDREVTLRIRCEMGASMKEIIQILNSERSRIHKLVACHLQELFTRMELAVPSSCKTKVKLAIRAPIIAKKTSKECEVTSNKRTGVKEISREMESAIKKIQAAFRAWKLHSMRAIEAQH